jgi:hypothetical protein
VQLTLELNQNLTTYEIFHLANAIINVRTITKKRLEKGEGFVSTDIEYVSVQRYGNKVYFTIILKNQIKIETETRDLTIGEIEAIKSFAVKQNSELFA